MTPAPSPERIGSIRTNVFMDEQKEWLIERVNAGMGEWEYVISNLGEYYAIAPSEEIARSIVEMATHTCPTLTSQHDAAIIAQAREDVLKEAHEINAKRFCPSMLDMHYHCCDVMACLDEIFESLRHTTTQGGEQ